jgi:hypothetical protein
VCSSLWDMAEKYKESIMVGGVAVMVLGFFFHYFSTSCGLGSSSRPSTGCTCFIGCFLFVLFGSHPLRIALTFTARARTHTHTEASSRISAQHWSR